MSGPLPPFFPALFTLQWLLSHSFMNEYYFINKYKKWFKAFLPPFQKTSPKNTLLKNTPYKYPPPSEENEVSKLDNLN